MEKTNKKFRKVTGLRLRNTSLLHQFNLLEDVEENEIVLNIWRSYGITDAIKNNESNVYMYDVEEEDWWDIISYKSYENENIWWIIALTNDVINPFEELSAGDRIKIIDGAFLYQILKEVKGISEI